MSNLGFVFGSVVFDGSEYRQVHRASEGPNQLVELLKGKESVKNWSTMISVHSYPAAREIGEIVGPHVDARKHLFAIKPEVFQKDLTEHKHDVLLQLFLGAPGQTPHVEFVLARFVQPQEGGCYAVIYSHKLKAKKNIDVSEVMNQKDKWIEQLSDIPVSMLELISQPGEGGNSE